MVRGFIALLLAWAVSTQLQAAGPFTGVPDYEREARLGNQIRDAIFDGEVIDLDANGREFMAIHMEPESESKGAVIILHGRGYHADWEDVVNPLRVGLTESGWHTLSLQMPVLEKTAKYFDYIPLFPYSGPRIEAGIRYLKEQGIDKVILFAHSCSVHMTMSWLAEKGDDPIDGYIGAGMGATDFGQPLKTDYPLETMKVPVLDLYGANEYPAVIRAAPARKAAMEKAGNPLSAQKVLPEADHYFTGIKEPLVELVAQWLEELR